MATVRLKRKLRGKDGGKHPHLKNAQDFPQSAKTPEYCRQRLREIAKTYLTMAKAWESGRQSETIARAAVLNLIDTLDKERS